MSQVEEATAIRTRYLRALEEEDFRVLPGPTYAKGFLRAYAEYLGLDGQLFIDEFNSRHHDPRRELEQPIYSRPRSRPQQRRQRRESNLIMITLAAIVAVASLIFIASTYNNNPHALPVGPPPTSGNTGGPGSTPQGGSTTQGTSTATTPKHKAKHPRFTVVLSVTSPCWVDLHTGSPTGPAALTTHRTSLAGYKIDPAVASSVTIASRKPLFLSQIGAPSSLSITIDGHHVVLPAGTDSATVLRITKTGIAQA